MNLADGTLIGGRYRIVKFLGQGGFGCTYLVQHAHLNKRYAVKEFFVADICNRDGSGRVSVGTQSKVEEFDRLLKKFIKEANALVDLSGIKGIVNVVDVFEENGTAYFVMDYIEGMSVERMLQLDGPMSEQMAVQIVRETARALAEVHKRNYLHLDIKPDNIMLDFDYHPTLIDFGVSKQYDAADGHNSSTLMGHTPGFAPMEQTHSKVGKFYPATDIYALGATLYCMLTGQTPDTPSDRLNFPRPIADDLPAGTGPNVAAAIEAAMQLRVSDRPQSIADFLAILDGTAGKRVEKSKKQGWKWIKNVADVFKSVTNGGRQQNNGAEKGKTQKIVESYPSVSFLETILEKRRKNKVEFVGETVYPYGTLNWNSKNRKNNAGLPQEDLKPEKRQEYKFFVWSEAPNLSMVIRYNDKVYYVTESEWRKVPELTKKEVEKLGLVVKEGKEAFMIEPSDLTSERLTWNEAMERYGNRLPNKEQGEVMARQYKDIKRLQSAFGLSPMDNYYWTRTVNCSSLAWSVSMTGGLVSYFNKTATSRVRAVAPVPVASAI